MIYTGLNNTTQIVSNTGTIAYGGGNGKLLNSNGTQYINTGATITNGPTVKSVVVLNDKNDLRFLEILRL